MTYNEKKRFLESYTVSVRKIKGLQRELEEWTTIATNITQKLKPIMVQNGLTNSKIEECAIKIANIEDQIVQEISKAEQNKQQIEAAVNTIKDSRRREIITLRYINGLSVAIISYELDKEYDNVYKMIRTAIKSMNI